MHEVDIFIEYAPQCSQSYLECYKFIVHTSNEKLLVAAFHFTSCMLARQIDVIGNMWHPSSLTILQ